LLVVVKKPTAPEINGAFWALAFHAGMDKNSSIVRILTVC
jgi:hypothetical protein